MMINMRLDKELFLYIVFGIFTTVVNIVVYFLLAHLLSVNYIISNIISWFFSVLFAYVTNRLWVFESKNSNIFKEISLFFGGRLFSGVIDTFLMFLFISVLLINDDISKIVIQVIVIILNYVISKVIVFKEY